VGVCVCVCVFLVTVYIYLIMIFILIKQVSDFFSKLEDSLIPKNLLILKSKIKGLAFPDTHQCTSRGRDRVFHFLYLNHTL
jgi:hypothetical protein